METSLLHNIQTQILHLFCIVSSLSLSTNDLTGKGQGRWLFCMAVQLEIYTIAELSVT